MSEIDKILRGTLRELAEEARGAPELATRAVARGRRLRTRRHVQLSLAVVLAVAAVGTPYLVVRASGPGAAPAPQPASGSASARAAYPRSTGPTTLPEAEGVPGAADRPDLVGTDPGVLHFDVQRSVVPGLWDTHWQTAPGVEEVQIAFAPKGRGPEQLSYVTVQLARTRIVAPDEVPGKHVTGDGRTVLIPPQSPELTQETTVRGRPATLGRFAPPDSTPPSPPTWKLLWQPVDGLWARVVARDWNEHVLRAVAETLRLDRAQRCVQPLQATALPPGTRWTGSHVGISSSTELDRGGDFPGLGLWWYSGFTLDKADSRTITVRLEPPNFPNSSGSPKDQFRPNLTVAGQPAQWTDPYRRAQGQLVVAYFQQRFTLFVLADSEAEAVAVAARLRVLGDLAKPQTWPRRTVL
ncbi:MAG TPA: hypothetical protein VFM55_20220 [Micromonosporaceae bacterium]|nr:hypothetical protein [Micromonosporaceae bacterium]